MIAFSGLRQMDNKDWLMQLPFLVVNAGMAGLLGAAFNSLRMWLWKVRSLLALSSIPFRPFVCQPPAGMFASAMTREAGHRCAKNQTASLRCELLVAVKGRLCVCASVACSQVRAVKTRHLLRILEVIGLVFLVSLVGHFFGWAAGTCQPLPEEWKEEEYGFRWAPPQPPHAW